MARVIGAECGTADALRGEILTWNRHVWRSAAPDGSPHDPGSAAVENGDFYYGTIRM